MSKTKLRRYAEQAEDRAQQAEIRAAILSAQLAELKREVEDKRKNWAPIKIAHPYTPRDPGCMLCDDPAEDPRHATPRVTA